MKLSEVKSALMQLDKVQFMLPNGTFVPAHFHITEVGTIQRNFIDCGGKIRSSRGINFQLWSSEDFDHRLSSGKLLKIISIAESALNLTDEEVNVEFQQDTVGNYSLDFNDGYFILQNTYTDCLAKDNCGVPLKNEEVTAKMAVPSSCCAPGSNCC